MLDDLDIYWMQHALALAHKAQAENEVPVGAVLILNNQLIGQGWNQPIGQCDPSAHAEIMAIRQGAQHLGNYRLSGSQLYVTIEPCMMCLGAMMHARVKQLIYGAPDDRSGLIAQIHQPTYQYFNHTIMVQGGVLELECRSIMQDFFKKKRSKISTKD